MADVKSTDIKVGETYRVRLTARCYGTARVVDIYTDLVHKNVVTGVKVQWLDGDRARTVVNPATFETL